MDPITITHSLGSYPVHVEPGALLSLPEIAAHTFRARRLVLITDETVSRLYDEWTSATASARRLGARASDAGIRLRCEARLTFPAGEAFKTRDTWIRLTDEMLALGLGRDSAVIAIGGGVVGDVAGFVAATYMRGLPCAQVPTTLLAMLDASVGGKVGVDTPHGKNLIGAFHPPAFVVADPLTVINLPDRHYRAGLAEAVKHGLIADRAYFEWIESRARTLVAKDLEALTYLIRRSVEIKAAIVGEDERESGRRATLNAGHTVAHALERESGYRLPHGEAVALGLIAECRMAERLGLAPKGLGDRLTRVLSALGLPKRVRESLPPARVRAAMSMDKKNREGAVRFALPIELGAMHQGDGTWTVPVEPQAIEEALATIIT